MLIVSVQLQVLIQRAAPLINARHLKQRQQWRNTARQCKHVIKHPSVSEQHLFCCSGFRVSAPSSSVFILNGWTYRGCSSVAVVSSSSSSSSILFLKVPTQLQKFLLFLFLVPGPRRWTRRGLWIKLSSTQWSSCTSKLRVGCLSRSPCSLHSTETMQRMNRWGGGLKICARIPHLPDVSEGGRHNSCQWRRKKDRKKSLKESLSTRGRQLPSPVAQHKLQRKLQGRRGFQKQSGRKEPPASAAPAFWHQLPVQVHQADTVSVFNTTFKTFLCDNCQVRSIRPLSLN